MSSGSKINFDYLNKIAMSPTGNVHTPTAVIEVKHASLFMPVTNFAANIQEPHKRRSQAQGSSTAYPSRIVHHREPQIPLELTREAH